MPVIDGGRHSACSGQAGRARRHTYARLPTRRRCRMEATASVPRSRPPAISLREWDDGGPGGPDRVRIVVTIIERQRAATGRRISFRPAQRPPQLQRTLRKGSTVT